MPLHARCECIGPKWTTSSGRGKKSDRTQTNIVAKMFHLPPLASECAPIEWNMFIPSTRSQVFVRTRVCLLMHENNNMRTRRPATVMPTTCLRKFARCFFLSSRTLYSCCFSVAFCVLSFSRVSCSPCTSFDVACVCVCAK